jgi:hypothetical protein
MSGMSGMEILWLIFGVIWILILLFGIPTILVIVGNSTNNTSMTNAGEGLLGLCGFVLLIILLGFGASYSKKHY